MIVGCLSVSYLVSFSGILSVLNVTIFSSN